MSAIIKIENLVKRYKERIAVDHFSLEVEEGEIFGLLGPNGSGKTTIINCLLALLQYDKGTIEIFGKPMNPNSYDSKKNIGVILQNIAVFQELTTKANIDYFCSLYIRDKRKRKELVKEALDFVGLWEFRNMYPKKLSGGLLRRLNIACGIAHKPKLIFMDEPTVAVDPQSRNNILEGIQKLNREGATIIYTSHYMEEVEQICTNIVIIDQGKQIAHGSTKELKSIIKMGETISIELLTLDPVHLNAIRQLPNVYQTEYKEHLLKIRCQVGNHNLIHILDYLKQQGISTGRIYTELPTLNDVFLEMTGRGLRD